MLTLPFTRRQMRRTAYVTLFAWLFALLSGAVNACLIQPSATDPARSNVLLVDPTVGKVAGQGQAIRQIESAQHHAHDEHAGPVDDPAPVGCLKFCADESSAVTKSKAATADLPGPSFVSRLDWQPASPVADVVSWRSVDQPASQGTPLFIRLLRLTIELDQQRADAMQAQHGLLLLRLGGHRSHSWLLHCRPDRPRIGCVGLVGRYEGPNELRVQQDDIVPQCLDLARPPVRAAACLQRDSTWWSTTQVLDQIVTPNRRFTISPESASTQ